ncbi:MAG: methionine gamma-lyase family protein [Bacilli bacterium]|nr:methionine gamma-lyase family protein [Bacilli bacterium]
MIDYETIVNREESLLKDEFEKLDDICFYNSNKVLKAFKKNNISENCFNSTTGYGYSDIGREAIEKVYADIFKTEDALVRTQFVSGSHTLTVCLFALLRPNDLLLSISGTPYDTLHEVIGIRDNDSSLKSYGVKYDQIDLVENDFDYDRVKEYLTNNKVKVIEIQRSKGYSTRKSISLSKIEKVTKLIKEVSPETIIMVDNCYCEFVNKKEVTEVGVDIACGSLIKNLGAGIASNGGYIVGRADLIKLCAERLTLPGEGKEVGPTQNSNRDILKGLFLAPSVVRNAVKTAILTAKVMESFGYEVDPKYNEERVEIVQNIIFHDRDKLIKYCQGIQKGSPIDSNVVPIPAYMPGYEDDVIMASGSFTQGSSIELSCDGPLREPFSAYQQGSLTYEYGKLGLLSALMELDNE